MGLKCPLCKDAKILPIDKGEVVDHLIVTKDKKNLFHIHGPMDNKALVQDMVIFVLKEAGIGYSISQGLSPETDPEDDKKQD